MTLETFDLLWNIPLLLVVFGGLWMTFKSGHDPKVMWPWHAASAVVWFVNSFIEEMQGDTLWVWISAFLGVVGVVNALNCYYLAKRQRDDDKDDFEKFRIN